MDDSWNKHATRLYKQQQQNPRRCLLIGSGELISGAHLIITESNLSVATADKAPIKVEHRTNSSTQLSTLFDLTIGSKNTILLSLENFIYLLCLEERRVESLETIRAAVALFLVIVT